MPLTVGTQDECLVNQVEIDGSFNLPSELQVSCVYEFRDAYFKFTVPSSGIIRLIYNSSTYENNFAAVFYNDCNGLEIICFDERSDKIVPGLIPGEEIILRMVDRNMAQFDLCIVEVIPAINNTCENAAVIEVSELGMCIENFTLVDIEDNTLEMESSCSFGEGADAFFQFEVPESGQIRIYSSISIGIAIYPACSAESLFCDLFNNPDDIIDLTPGETLILQVFQRDARNFEICIEDAKPPQNDTCENAMPITIGVPGECNATTFEVLNINSKTTNPSSCQSTDEVDSYFSFTVPQSGSIYLTTLTLSLIHI